MAKYCDIPYKVRRELEDKIKKEILQLLKDNGVSLDGATDIFNSVIDDIKATSLDHII